MNKPLRQIKQRYPLQQSRVIFGNMFLKVFQALLHFFPLFSFQWIQKGAKITRQNHIFDINHEMSRNEIKSQYVKNMEADRAAINRKFKQKSEKT